MQCLTDVINPPQIKDIRMLAKMVEEWEVRVHRLKMQTDEDLSPNVQSAKQERVLIDDMTFTPIQEENLDYKRENKLLKILKRGKMS